MNTNDGIMLNLVPERAEKFQGKFPVFKQPEELGTFSLDESRGFFNDKRNLKFYKRPPPHLTINLSHGYSQFIRKESNKNEKIDTILRWLLANREKVVSEGRGKHCLSTDFICFRGLLTVIVSTPYEKNDGWIICATKFRGTIYLCAFDTADKSLQRQTMSERQKLMTYWGYKFEQYMTVGSLENEVSIDGPVNENEEFCTMCKTKLNSFSIIYGAEVDCTDVSLKNTNSTERYIELKTSRIITSSKQDWSFKRYKLLKWWAQSFLIGIPKLICGFRDDDGFVVKIEEFQTRQLAKMSSGIWDPSVCFNFCDRFLDAVKRLVIKDDPLTVYKFTWNPGDDIRCLELQGPSEYQFLPEWYTNTMLK